MSYSTFTTSDYAAIARYLGYSFQSNHIQQIQALCAPVAALGGDYILPIKELLEELRKIEGELNDARPFASRSFQSSGTGTAQHFRGERMHHLRAEGYRLVQQLCQMINTAPRRNIFATGGNGSVVV